MMIIDDFMIGATSSSSCTKILVDFGLGPLFLAIDFNDSMLALALVLAATSTRGSSTGTTAFGLRPLFLACCCNGSIAFVLVTTSSVSGYLRFR